MLAKITITMRGNQLPVSAARWQLGSLIVYAIVFSENHKIAKNSTANKGREKI
jgi:hypothetical protein